MLSEIKQDAATRMKGAVQALEEDLSGIRTGRAHPALIEKLPVEYYGIPTPLIQLGAVPPRVANAPGGRENEFAR